VNNDTPLSLSLDTIQSIPISLRAMYLSCFKKYLVEKTTPKVAAVK